MKIIIITAKSRNNIIGNKGKLPWHSSEELNHFKNITYGHPVVMGRKTWESLTKPLENRLNIVLTRNKEYKINIVNTVVLNNVDEVLEYCNSYEKIYIIGGRQVYEAFIDIACEMYISEMKFDVEGDTQFPPFHPEEWTTTKKEFNDFLLYHYIRIN
ncbi:dihydrofolate reductase [Melioribacter sp. OK-6-Me]|uniref:dihydrofolate reductase n=1 Tax=unclassified Melioribacter TaxID=2627329 RepID=UPI003EDA1BA2